MQQGLYLWWANSPIYHICLLNGDDTENKLACVEPKQDYMTVLNAFKVTLIFQHPSNLNIE